MGANSHRTGLECKVGQRLSQLHQWIDEGYGDITDQRFVLFGSDDDDDGIDVDMLWDDHEWATIGLLVMARW